MPDPSAHAEEPGTPTALPRPYAKRFARALESWSIALIRLAEYENRALALGVFTLRLAFVIFFPGPRLSIHSRRLLPLSALPMLWMVGGFPRINIHQLLPFVLRWINK